MTTIWDQMRRMQEEMDSVFNNFFRSDPFRSKNLLSGPETKDLALGSFAEPTADIYETDKEVVAEIDVPGVDKKDIEVSVTDDGVEVKAERKDEAKTEEKGIHRYERSYSGFYRRFSLPGNVDADKAKAEYKNGVLKITVPKTEIEEKKKKLLPIN